ncbi:hypothetical protein HDK77DRAFT_427259 [Phyllosticta capitalensis]
MAQESRPSDTSDNLDDLFQDWPADVPFSNFDTSFLYDIQENPSNDLVSLPSGDTSGLYQPQHLQVTIPEATASVDSANPIATQTISEPIYDPSLLDDFVGIVDDNLPLTYGTRQTQAAEPPQSQYLTAVPGALDPFGLDNTFYEQPTSTWGELNIQSQQTAPYYAPPTVHAPVASSQANAPPTIQTVQALQSRPRLDSPDFAASTVHAPVAPSKAALLPPRSQAVQALQSRTRLDSPEFTAPINIADYKLERPEHDSKHSWVRINKTTMGLTKRSGKINTYDPEKMYETFAHPQGPWQSTSFQFMYAPHGELSMPTYSVEQIKQFIYEHPVSADCKLRLWIQKCAADSARRYPTSTLNRCRFANCPVRDVLGNDGTMIAGHYRVCVDEKSFKHDQRVDPYKTTAYFHLYCFEKFLDLPDVCRLPNVEVRADLRQFQSEPKSKFNASLAGERAGAIAERFIESCRRQKTDATTGRPLVRYLGDYRVYPQHRGNGWYEDTLSYHMIKDKEANRAASSKHALAARAQKFSQIQHNLGNLDLFARAKLAERKPAKQPVQRKKRSRAAALEEGYDSDDSEVFTPPRRRRRGSENTTSSAYAAPAALPHVVTPSQQPAFNSAQPISQNVVQSMQAAQHPQTQPLAPLYPDFFASPSTYTAPPQQQNQQQQQQSQSMYPTDFDDLFQD